MEILKLVKETKTRISPANDEKRELVRLRIVKAGEALILFSDEWFDDVFGVSACCKVLG